MGDYIGDFATAATVRKKFNTCQADGTPITLAGTPVAKCYKAASTTESATGVTLTVDFDGLTGFHQVAVDTSSDGTFYAAGADFSVVLTAGTVDAISAVGVELCSFSLLNRNRAGIKMASDGLDLVIVEPAAGSVPAINARQSLALIMDAAPAGVITGAGTSAPVIMNPGGTVTRLTATTDADGNRSAIVATPPA